MIHTYRKMSLPSEVQSIREVDKFVEELCAEFNVPDSKCGEIRVAVKEATTNAVYHGYTNDKARLFFVEFEFAEDSILKFVITDTGKGFDHESIPDPSDSSNLKKETGRGVFLMKKLADRCTFNKGGSEVVLEFELGCS